MYVHACIYIYIYIYMYIHTFIYTYKYVYICKYIYIHMYRHMYIYMNMYIHILIQIYICTYICMYIYSCTYICTIFSLSDWVTVFDHPPATPSFWREFPLWTYVCLESPGWEKQGGPPIRANGDRGACKLLINSRLMSKSLFLDTPLATPSFWRELAMCTYVCPESPGWELHDAPWIMANGARGGSKCPTPSRKRSKSPFSHILQPTPSFWWELAM